MNSLKNKLQILTSRIVPAVAVLSLFAAGHAQAGGSAVDTINAKLATIPGMKIGTTVATAKADALLYALTLALDALPANATATDYANLVSAALQKDAAAKFRSDKDKIAGQVIATAIANNNLTDPAIIAAITKAVFNVNAGDPRAALTAVGQGVALSGAIKASNSAAAAAIGAAIGGGGAGEFTGIASTLLSNTSVALGTSASKAADSFEAFTQGFLTDEFGTDGERSAVALAASQVVAARVPAAAGSIIGGFIATKGGVATSSMITAYMTDSKLAKALGDIVGSSMETHANKVTLLTDLFGISGLKDANKPLIAQGVLRAGTAGDATGVMDAYIATSPDVVKVAGVVASGNGDNESKLSTIVSKLAAGQDPAVAKPAIGIAVISAVGLLNPESADAAIKALIGTGGFADPTSRNALGVKIAPKVKSFSAVGFMAAGIAELNIAASPANANSAAVETANAIASKASKAAEDIVYRVASLSTITSKQTFAVALANANNKLSLNAAVGASLADETNAGDITAAVINRPADRAAIAAASKIAAAVASKVDEERASEIVFKVGSLVSETGTALGKPLKATTFKSLATAIAKAIQAKSGVTTANRGDELGEQGALLTNLIIQAFGGNQLNDPSRIAARDKLIASVGSEFLKALSKTSLEESKTLQADQSAADDIAGSIALTIHSSGLPPVQRDALLKSTGVLQTAFLKLAGKAGTSDSNALIQAITDVRDNPATVVLAFEDGTKTAELSTTFNDKETDKRNR